MSKRTQKRFMGELSINLDDLLTKVASGEISVDRAREIGRLAGGIIRRDGQIISVAKQTGRLHEGVKMVVDTAIAYKTAKR